MRWKLCKTYQKRVDDPLFEELNDAQLLWYQTQINLDMKDQFEMMRDIAEHNAMFMNPQGVKQVREAREKTFETPTEDFEDMIEEMFGRKIPEKQEKGSMEDVVKNIKSDNLLDIELDDISFTPYGEE